MSGISTHILDVALGRPAAGLAVALHRLDEESWTLLVQSRTDGDGRCRPLLDSALVQPGIHRLTFVTRAYFEARDQETLYPVIDITFNVTEGQTNYHIPLLLSPFGYTTYRGS